MLKQLAQKLIEARRLEKSLVQSFIEKEIIGKRFELSFSGKALTINADDHTAEFVMSTNSIDRHGDVIDQDSWIFEYFDQNPAFFWQHESDNFPLGSWVERRLEADPENPGAKRLVGKARFDTDIEPLAERAWKHVERGNLRMVSVGFIPHRIEYDETRDAFILYDCELLECSLVGIGSNRQALIKEQPEKEEETTARDAAIGAKQALETQLRDNRVIAHLKAREDLNRAIRRMKSNH